MTKLPIFLALLLFLITACGESSDGEAPDTEITNNSLAAVDSPAETLAEKSPAENLGESSPENAAKLKQAYFEQYIGLEYRDPPEELRKFAGWLVGSPEVQPAYGMSWIVDASCEFQPCPAGTISMLWFEVVEVGTQPTYRVLDVVLVPDLPEDFSEQIFSTCQQGEEIDPEIVAIAKYDPEAEILPTIQAWRANRETETLEEIPPDGVRCYNPGYGL